MSDDWIKNLSKTHPLRVEPYLSHIPERTLTALENYLYEGEPKGHFLQAVLNNDLFEAMFRADDGNLEALPWIVKLIYNEFPQMAKDHDEWVAKHYSLRMAEEDEAPVYPTNTPARDARHEHDPSL